MDASGEALLRRAGLTLRPCISVVVSVSQEHAVAAGIKDDAPVVGLVLQKSHINTKDECHYVALVAELEARGAKVKIGEGAEAAYYVYIEYRWGVIFDRNN